MERCRVGKMWPCGKTRTGRWKYKKLLKMKINTQIGKVRNRRIDKVYEQMDWYMEKCVIPKMR